MYVLTGFQSKSGARSAKSTKSGAKGKVSKGNRRQSSATANDLREFGDLERGLEDESDSDVEEVSQLKGWIVQYCRQTECDMCVFKAINSCVILLDPADRYGGRSGRHVRRVDCEQAHQPQRRGAGVESSDVRNLGPYLPFHSVTLNYETL